MTEKVTCQRETKMTNEISYGDTIVINGFKVYSYDVETDWDPKKKTGLSYKNRIMSINVVWENEKGERFKDCITDESEKKIFEIFQERYIKPNVKLVGFNSDKFDKYRIIHRAKSCGIDLTILHEMDEDIRKFLPLRRRGHSTLKNYGLDIGYNFSTCAYGKLQTRMIWRYKQYPKNHEFLKEKLLDDANITWELLTKGMPKIALTRYWEPRYPIENQGVINYMFNELKGGVAV